MARISTYPLDSTLTAGDTLIGTNDAGQTINVTSQTVVDFINTSGKLQGNVSSRFTYIPYVSGARSVASFALTAPSADSLAFSGITDLVISDYTVNDANFSSYFNAISGGRIIVQKAIDISQFGIFDVTDVNDTEGQTNFKTLDVTHVHSNGTLEKDEDYFIFLLQYDNDISDKNYVHTQQSVSTTWSVTHNLEKRPSVTVVDSADNVVIGDVEYVDNNNVTITFASAFSGKAYFN